MDAETDADATDARAGSMLDREEEAEAARRRRRRGGRPRLAVDVDVGAFVNWRTGGTPVKTRWRVVVTWMVTWTGRRRGWTPAGRGRRRFRQLARRRGRDNRSAPRASPASTSPEPREEIVGMETREEIETRRACLLTTRFERTGTPLDGVDVASGRIMGASHVAEPASAQVVSGGRVALGAVRARVVRR